jgi:hypothetical protein
MNLQIFRNFICSKHFFDRGHELTRRKYLTKIQGKQQAGLYIKLRLKEPQHSNSSNPRSVGEACSHNLGRIYRQIRPALIVLQIGLHAMAMRKHSGSLLPVQGYLNKLALNVAEIALKNLKLKTGCRMFAPDDDRFHSDCLFL